LYFCSTGKEGYAIFPMIARGNMLGPDQPMILHLLDIEDTAEALKGVKMELIDAAFPLLKGLPLNHTMYLWTTAYVYPLSLSFDVFLARFSLLPFGFLLIKKNLRANSM